VEAMSKGDVDEGEAGEGELIEQSLFLVFPLEEEGSGECREIIKSWLAQLRERGGADQYMNQLEDACDVLEATRDACWSNWCPTRRVKRVPQTLWAWPSDDAFVIRPKEWCADEVSPANLDELDSAMTQYLKHPWMRHDTIDVSVINALLFTELALFLDELKSGRAIGTINWSYLFAQGNMFNSLLGRLIRFLMAWVMLPAIAAGFLAYGYEAAALVTISIWALYVFYRIITIPARKKAAKVCKAMEKAWNAARGRIINPSHLRELVLAAEECGAVFRPVLHTLIDQAIQRDAATLMRQEQPYLQREDM
jgi:hypothetical protein